MTFDIWSALVLLGLFGMVLGGLWRIIPRLHGLPKGAPRPVQIRRALALADVQPGERVCDLNAAHGQGMVIAAREYGATAAGYHVEPVHRAAVWLRALFSGVVSRVSVHKQSPLDAPLADADVVLLYLTPALIRELQPRLASELREGARVVSFHFDLEGWEPAGMDIGHLLFLYELPPRQGSYDTYLKREFSLT